MPSPSPLPTCYEEPPAWTNYATRHLIILPYRLGTNFLLEAPPPILYSLSFTAKVPILLSLRPDPIASPSSIASFPPYHPYLSQRPPPTVLYPRPTAATVSCHPPPINTSTTYSSAIHNECSHTTTKGRLGRARRR